MANKSNPPHATAYNKIGFTDNDRNGGYRNQLIGESSLFKSSPKFSPFKFLSNSPMFSSPFNMEDKSSSCKRRGKKMSKTETSNVEISSNPCPISLCVGQSIDTDAVLDHLISAHHVPVVCSAEITISTLMGMRDYSILHHGKCRWVPTILNCFNTGFLIFLNETKDYYSIWVSRINEGKNHNEEFEVHFDIQNYDVQQNSTAKNQKWEGKVNTVLQADLCDTFIIMKTSLLKNFCMLKLGKYVWTLDVAIHKTTENSPRCSSGYLSEELLDDYNEISSCTESFHMDLPTPISHRKDASTNTDVESISSTEFISMENDNHSEGEDSVKAESMIQEAEEESQDFRMESSNGNHEVKEEYFDCPFRPYDDNAVDAPYDIELTSSVSSPIQDCFTTESFERSPSFIYCDTTTKLYEKLKKIHNSSSFNSN